MTISLDFYWFFYDSTSHSNSIIDFYWFFYDSTSHSNSIIVFYFQPSRFYGSFLFLIYEFL